MCRQKCRSGKEEEKLHRYDIELDENADDALNLLVKEIPDGCSVLELGCGNGRFTRYLAERKMCRVSIVDYDSFLFGKARDHAAYGLCTDLTQEEWTEYYRGMVYDRIVLSDVLEHLSDPAAILKSCRSFLAPEGCLLISVPNFAHNDILLQLYRDDLPRADTGIMDYTHMTMFTRQGLKNMLRDAGYRVEKLEGVSRLTGETEQLIGRSAGPENFVKVLEQREFGHVYQWVVKAVPELYIYKKEDEREDLLVNLKELKDELSGRERDLQYLNKKYLQNKKLLTAAYRENSARDKKLVLLIDEIREYEERVNNLQEKIAGLEEEKKQILKVSGERDENISHLTRVIGAMEQREEYLRQQVRELYQQTELYSSSTSWKITRPCRAVGNALRHFAGTEGAKEIPDAASRGGFLPAHLCLPGSFAASEDASGSACTSFDQPLQNYHPLVSVIVPCYMHADYLEERLHSISGQTYDRLEVILLDDGSDDGSREILEKWEKKFINVKICMNEAHTGKVFGQWQKGIRMAQGELIWIAESDDSCLPDLLEHLVPFFAHECVMLAFAGSDFVRDGKTVWTSEEYLANLDGFSWDRDFIMSSREFVRRGFGILNVIPNVSACVFRNTGEISKGLSETLDSMHLCGDWLFYLSLLRGGYAAYSSRSRNFYRIHENSTSSKVQKTDIYYREYGKALYYSALWYGISGEELKRAEKKLAEHFMTERKVSFSAAEEEIKRLTGTYYIPGLQKKLHVLMCAFSLRAGGGETFAVHLANTLRSEDVTVTFLDYRGEERDDRIRSMLRKDIPLVSLSSTDHLMEVMEDCGAEIVHTHHASVDGAVAKWLSGSEKGPGMIVTLHGMYETIPKADMQNTVRLLSGVCSKYVYIADKNLEPFIRCKVYRKKLFRKIENALPDIPPVPVSRASLGFSDDDFVCAIASRGIPEKGWSEAVEAVHAANKTAGRTIRLVILGDGEMRAVLENEEDIYVRFTGVVDNVRDYFRMADVGLLPTCFKGESSPLAVIECLQAGRPVIATDIGEVRRELTDENGDLAGRMLHLKHGKVQVKELARELIFLADHPEEYAALAARCGSAAAKFDMKAAARQYMEVYKEIKSLHKYEKGIEA